MTKACNRAPRKRSSFARLCILQLLKNGAEMTGGEIVRNAAISKGSVYTTLHRMEAAALLTSRIDRSVCNPGSAPRYYKITPRGTRVLVLQAELNLLLERN